MQPQQSEHFVKPIETKTNAPWLVRMSEADNVSIVQYDKKGITELHRVATPDEIRDRIISVVKLKF